MTPNQAKIVITNPCSENWNSMEPVSSGRFCQSCQKSVVDFTSRSDSEIKIFLQEKQGDRLCGRFFVHQVERIRIEIDPDLLVSGIPFWQKFLVILLVCFGPDFLGVNFVFAQTEPDSIPVAIEQVDSLVPVSQELDTTLEVIVDSLIKFNPTKIERCSIASDPIIFPEYVMGDFVFRKEDYYPEEKIPFPFIKHDPEADTLINKTGIAHAENIPAVPKRRKRKPALPESAVITAFDDRRKTKRS